MTIARLSAPVLPEVIRRQRLLDQLDGAFRRQQPVWIWGPPGSGKTTLVANYLERTAVQAVWYQLDPTDSDPAAFFHYLAVAAEIVSPGIRSSVPRLTPEYLAGLPVFTRRFCEKLYEGLPSPCLLVFDNYQEIDAASPIHSLLKILFSNAPVGKHPVLISRHAPPKSLTRLRANQQMQVLDWKDVRFSAAESDEFLKLKGIDDPRSAHEIADTARGWVAGMILLQEAGDWHRSSIAPGEGQPLDYQLTFDYFASEILTRSPAPVPDVLIRASLFADFTVDMLEPLSGVGRAEIETIFSDLHERAYFTERHPGSPPRYSFHPLFHRYLRSECHKRFSKSEVDGLKEQAAGIALQQHQIENAAHLLIECCNWPKLADLCEDRAEAMLQAGRHATLGDWLGRLPRELLDERPWLCLSYGCAQLPLTPKAAGNQFERAYRVFKVRGDTTGRYHAWALAVEGINFAWDDFSAAAFWIDELEELQQDTAYPSAEIECRILMALLALLIWSEGGTVRFPGLIDRCYRLLHSVSEPSANASIAASIVYFQNSVAADSRAGAEIIDSMHTAIVNGEAMTVVKLYWYAQVLIFSAMTGRYTQGLQAVDEALELIEESGIRVLESTIASLGAWMHLSRADDDRAEAMLKKADAAMSSERRLERTLYLALLAKRSFQDNDLQGALDVLERTYSIVVDTRAAHPVAVCVDLLCHAYLKLGDWRRARRYYMQLKSIADQSGNTGYRYLLLLLDAQWMRYAGDTPSFKQALAGALQFGREHRIVQVFCQCRPTTELYELALVYGIEQEYVTTVVQALQLKPPDLSRVPANWPSPVRIIALGRLAIEVNGEAVDVSARQKRVLQLLRLLIVEHRHALSKDRVKSLIWPEADADKAEQNFKSTVVRLRKLLGSGAIRWRDATLALDKQVVWVDYWAFRRLVDQPENTSIPDIETPTDMIARLYTGKLLEGCDEPWIVRQRERLHQRVCDIFVNGAKALLEDGDTAGALRICRLGLGIDRTVEVLYQCCISACITGGNYAEARRVYQACVESLSGELRTPPSAATRALMDMLPEE